MSESKSNTHEVEFSHPIRVEKIPAAGLVKNLQANDAERARLAKRFGLIEVSKLTAALTVHPAGLDQTVAISGTLIADVVQACVATLEPLPSHIKYAIDVVCMPPEEPDPEQDPSTVEMEIEEREHIIDGTIDLGELVAQNLGIALDPYPRKPDIEYIEAEYGGNKQAANPFAKLADWQKKPKG